MSHASSTTSIPRDTHLPQPPCPPYSDRPRRSTLMIPSSFRRNRTSKFLVSAYEPFPMFAPFPRAKRPRSPSPPSPDEYMSLASPLDMLIKRRRREASFTSDGYAIPGAYAPSETRPASQPESSTAWMARPGVNGRRSRQWQHLNAPSSSSQASAQSEAAAYPSHSQPPPQSNYAEMNGSSPYAGQHGRAYSQPEVPQGRHFSMSSSPIRHQAPGSSPFRASNGVEVVNGLETPVSDEQGRAEEESWGDDELGREWGEYARENSVLYSLHKHRNAAFTTPPHLNSYPTMTPIRQPQHPQTSYNSNSYAAPYRDHPPSAGSTQFPQSSPFAGAAASDVTHIDYDDHATDIGEDSGMEVLEDWPLTPQEAETRRQYEDANRLLAELAVARQRRWGET